MTETTVTFTIVFLKCIFNTWSVFLYIQASLPGNVLITACALNV